MKKILFVVTALVATAAFSFAAPPSEVLKVTASIEGNATVTFGYDLDNSDFGINNTNSGALKISFIPETTDAHGEGEVTGWVELSAFKIVDTFTIVAPTVKGRLFLGPVYLNIKYNDTPGKVDAASLSFYGNALTGAVNTNNVARTEVSESDGFELGLRDETLVILAAGMSSEWNYDNATNTNTEYNYWVKLGLGSSIVPGLSLNLKLLVDGVNDDIVFGGDVGFSTAIMEGYKLGVSAGYDHNITDSDNEVSGTVYLRVPAAAEKTKMTIGDTVDYEFYSGLNVGVIYDLVDSEIDVAATVFSADLAKPVTLVGFVETDNNLKNLGYGVKASVALDEAKIAAYVREWSSYAEGTAPSAKFELGVDYTGIPLTTFTVFYKSGNLLLSTPVKGTLGLTIKVAY